MAIKFLTLAFVFLTTSIFARKFDWQTANTTIWLSSGAYCPTEVYLNRTYYGYSTGFIPKKIISNNESDTQGYIGYHPDKKAIYVVIRGSTSLQNWIDDFDALQIPYVTQNNDSTECQDCYVHEGFSYAWGTVAETTIADVKELKFKFPDYRVVVTGHSLGGALASLCALALQQEFSAMDAAATEKYKQEQEKQLRKRRPHPATPTAPPAPTLVELWSYGSPRFGNQALAEYSLKLLGGKDTGSGNGGGGGSSRSNRVTHYRDMAPHCPPYMEYTHIQGET